MGALQTRTRTETQTDIETETQTQTDIETETQTETRTETRTRTPFQDLSDQTGFSSEQIRILHKRFRQLSGDEETISKENLEQIQALDNNPLRKQIIEAFFDKRNQSDGDVGSFTEIGFVQFVKVMCHFRPPGLKMTSEEREAMRTEKLRCEYPT
ncbi:hypothetical protein CRUP_005297 [Coryphaenoides rupestris]|nr:hypothetical protein CRUP_005297 [Coryphaenoides rupestris]